MTGLVVLVVAAWAGLTLDAWYREHPDPAPPDRNLGWVLERATGRRHPGIPAPPRPRPIALIADPMARREAAAAHCRRRHAIAKTDHHPDPIGAS